MTKLGSRTLFWTPRILAILYIAFLSIFSLDVFSEEHGFWRIVVALLIHLIPSFILLAVLILAWRWEWIGAALYGVAGLIYVAWTFTRPLTPAIRMTWILLIAGPAFLLAVLFLANWMKHDELHPRHP
jgi:lysylphosphatidylglycerol synthetase-like protein (DUF2156 family)